MHTECQLSFVIRTSILVVNDFGRRWSRVETQELDSSPKVGLNVTRAGKRGSAITDRDLRPIPAERHHVLCTDRALGLRVNGDDQGRTIRVLRDALLRLREGCASQHTDTYNNGPTTDLWAGITGNYPNCFEARPQILTATCINQDQVDRIAALSDCQLDFLADVRRRLCAVEFPN